ncbi:TraR/DksA family transcriptional regulator [Escherichia coli]|uniref:TraR/DksA family transcriptional regulator n=1 Tax=Escherichia coli TaxID=562 RepID=UPI003F772FC5
MADAMDLVQQRVEEERQRHIRAARAKTPGVSRVLCVECEAPIPPARRRAIPGVQLCITCQEIAELKGKHYDGSVLSTILKWAEIKPPLCSN